MGTVSRDNPPLEDLKHHLRPSKKNYTAPTMRVLIIIATVVVLGQAVPSPDLKAAMANIQKAAAFAGAGMNTGVKNFITNQLTEAWNKVMGNPGSCAWGGSNFKESFTGQSGSFQDAFMGVVKKSYATEESFLKSHLPKDITGNPLYTIEPEGYTRNSTFTGPFNGFHFLYNQVP